jgi:hypothetical protein
MTHEELLEQMLAFIESCDRDRFDEWYATPRDFASTVLSDFAQFLGVELVVPEYVPRKTKPEVDRQELFRQLMPEIERMFNLKYKQLENKEG